MLALKTELLIVINVVRFQFSKSKALRPQTYVFFGVKKTRLILLGGSSVSQPLRPLSRSAHQETIEACGTRVNREIEFSADFRAGFSGWSRSTLP